MTKKSGLADSPFFASVQPKVEALTPQLAEPDKVIAETKDGPLPNSPSVEKLSTPTLQARNEENQDQKRTNVLSDVRTNERSNERTNVRTSSKTKRQKIRHAFDIYQDQLLALQIRQLEAVQRGKRKPKLGKMVQDAIDLYLKQSGNAKR
jgi:hypothetical protein